MKKLLRTFLTTIAAGRDTAWLKGACGIIHVGANVGQERHAYAKRNLRVLWIEPIPNAYRQLCSNIEDYPQQRALQALITNEHGKTYEFNVANNTGASSSIHDFALHKELWPSVEFVEKLNIEGTTLSRLMETNGIPITDYEAILIDTQGSEVLVLEGAEELLARMRWVKVEAADFEAYEGGCQLSDIVEFLTARGFTELSRKVFARHKNGGAYYDTVWANTSSTGHVE